MRDWLQDLRHGLRQLGKNRAFTFVAIATLAIGIGANTAIFSVVESVLLKPFPYEDPDELVLLWERNLGRGFDKMFVAPPNFADWAEGSESFSHIAAFTTRDVTLTRGTGDPERIRSGRVSGELFALLGVEPDRGRALGTDDDRPGAGSVVVLSHGFAERRFGGAEEVLDSVINLDGTPHTVIGIMPAEFSFPPPIALEGDLPAEPVEIWTPLALDYASGQRGAHYLNVIGRLGGGVEIDTAQAEMNAIAAAMAEAYPSTNEGWDTALTPLSDQVTGGIRTALLVLFAAVAFVLLIACVNVANLLLTRGVTRQREMAVRAALGAGRRRIVRQLLTESFLLAVMGGVAGLVLAFWGIRALVALAPPNLPRIGEVGFDPKTVIFTLAVSALASIGFGLVPAFAAATSSLFEGLRDRDPRMSSGRSVRLGGTLVVSEVALALVLLVTAALLFRSFSNLSSVDPGFRASDVVIVSTTLPRAAYGEPEARTRLLERAVETIGGLPQVELVGAINEMPLVHDRQGTSVRVDGEPVPASGQEAQTAFSVVSPGYFQAMGIPLLRGRGIEATDRADQTRVVVINDALAALHFPDTDPIGRHLVLGMSSGDPWQVVGVVGGVRHNALANDPVPNVYLSYAQQPRSYGLSFVLRTRSEPEAVVGSVREAIRSIDASLPLFDVTPLEAVVERSIAASRFSSRLLIVFALAALVLAAIGLYGVVGYTMSQRIPEMGLRIALGASVGEVTRLVIGKGARLAALGIAAGLVSALALTRLVASLLYGVSAYDPTSFAVVASLLMSVALVAAYVPARRAAKVDPIVALRTGE